MANKVSIAVVTYNNSAKVEGLLLSMERFIDGIARDSVDVYLIDNASDDDTVQLVQRYFPWVKIQRNSSNRGFGFGHNCLLPLLGSQYHVVLNPDIVFIEDAISILVDYLEANPNVGQVTPRILNTDGSEQKLPKLRPRLRYLVARRFERLGGVAKQLCNQYTRASEDFTQPTEIEFCTGCFFVIKTALFKQLGGFDDEFFMYFEDCDLSCRVLDSGHKIIFDPSVQVIHHWTRASSKQFRAFTTQVRSMFKFFKKHGW